MGRRTSSTKVILCFPGFVEKLLSGHESVYYFKWQINLIWIEKKNIVNVLIVREWTKFCQIWKKGGLSTPYLGGGGGGNCDWKAPTNQALHRTPTLKLLLCYNLRGKF